MNYKLENATKEQETLLKKYKEKTILDNEDHLEESERKKIKTTLMKQPKNF